VLLAATLLLSLGWSAPALTAPQPQWVGGLGLAPTAAGGPLAMVQGCPRGFYERGGTTLPMPRRADGGLWVRKGDVAVLAQGDCRRRRLVLADVGRDQRVRSRTPLGADGYPLLTTGPGGAVGVAWIEVHGEDRYVLRAAVRPPGGRLSAPVTIARLTASPEDGGGVSDAAIAFLGDGRLLVAYSEPNAVKATVVAPGCARGPVVRLGPASQFSRVRAAVSRRGRAVVAWGTQDAGAERNLPYAVYAAIREPGAMSFRTRRLDRADLLADPTGDPELAIGPDGHAVLEWHDSARVRLAQAPPGRPFGRGRVLARDGVPGGVAVRDDGVTLATWVAGRRVRAQVGDGPVATVSWDVGFPESPPEAAFDAHGRAQVYWGPYVVSRDVP
jgi:hypothetical protein